MSDEFDLQSGPRNPFDLHPGMKVEVMTPENHLLFVGRVNTVYDGAVSIRDADDEPLAMVLVNKPLKLRFFREQDHLVLQGKVCGSTLKMWKIDRLESTFTQEQRAFFRQNISVELEAQCGRRPSAGGPAKLTFPCQVLDVSAGGMLISSKEEFRVGDRLYITGVPLVAGEPAFTFNCRVRRASVWKKGVIRYGCQFEALSSKEQDRLLRAIFTIQREEIRKRKGR